MAERFKNRDEFVQARYAKHAAAPGSYCEPDVRVYRLYDR